MSVPLLSFQAGWQTIQLDIADEADDGNEDIPSQANPGDGLNPHGDHITRLAIYVVAVRLFLF